MELPITIRLATLRFKRWRLRRYRAIFPKLPVVKTRPAPTDEKEFQRRLLAALERAPKNRFLAVINSPFFLWISTVLILSVGGATFTTRQQCIKEAEPLEAEFLVLQAYYSGKAFYIRLAADIAATPDEFFKRLSEYEASSKEAVENLLAAASIKEPLARAVYIYARLERRGWSEHEGKTAIADAMMLENEVSRLRNGPNEERRQTDYRTFKQRLAEQHETSVKEETTPEPYVVSDCGWWRTIQRLITGDLAVLRFEYPVPVPRPLPSRPK